MGKIYARHVLCKIIDVQFKCCLLPRFVIFDMGKNMNKTCL
jgi:hypothetical protein